MIAPILSINVIHIHVCIWLKSKTKATQNTHLIRCLAFGTWWLINKLKVDFTRHSQQKLWLAW